jgi:hypothetical protein
MLFMSLFIYSAPCNAAHYLLACEAYIPIAGISLDCSGTPANPDHSWGTHPRYQMPGISGAKIDIHFV